MAEKVSAIPDDLINWSGWAQGLNTDLRGAAKQLNQAIQDLNQSHPDPGILGPVAFAGNAAIGYAARNDSTDVWVGRVGQAFRSAATRGLPGGLIRANYDDFGRGLVTTDQSTISSQVGADPAAEAEKIRRAVELAEQVDEALAAGDADKARSLLNQLALDENWLDPTFDSAFFKELGPDGVRDVMPVIKDDEGLLVIFDNSLATATKAPDWDPAFNESLFPGPGPNWSPANHDLALLLKYGVYSEDFLTRAGDNILLGGTYDRNRPSDPWEEQLALEALSRNPDAALHYLLGHAFNPELKGPAFGPRVGELMVLYRQLFDTNPDLARAMGDLIGASAHASDARTVIVGPYGDEPQIQVLLHLLGEGHGYISNSEELRRGIAEAISAHIDLFVNVDSGVDWTWQKRLFWEAETNGRGEILQENVDAIKKAAALWAAQHIPHDYNVDDPKTWPQWQDWAKLTGNLYGLAALPERVAGYDEEHVKEAQAQFWATVEELVPVPLPEGHRILEYGVDALKVAGAKVIDAWGASGPPGVDADHKADQKFLAELSSMQLGTTQLFLSRHPELVPPGQDPLDFATAVASGQHVGSIQLQHFEDLLAQQGKKFEEQYFRQGVN